MRAMQLFRLNQAISSSLSSNQGYMGRTGGMGNSSALSTVFSPPLVIAPSVSPVVLGMSDPVTLYVQEQARKQRQRQELMSAAVRQATWSARASYLWHDPRSSHLSTVALTTLHASPQRLVIHNTYPSTTEMTLPRALSCPSDRDSLSSFQILLRQHVEAFSATSADTMIHARGRNKRIQLHQVGIRCRHCAHVPLPQRTKGAVYFPSSTLGVYQAAQNMSSTHLQCGLCPAMDDSIKTLFAQMMTTKTSTTTSLGGRAYWSRCAQNMGLVDTDEGIFPRDLVPHSASLLHPKEHKFYQNVTP